MNMQSPNQRNACPPGACSYWGWMLATGIVLILLGVLAFGSVITSTFVTVMFFAGLLVAAGVIQFINAFRTHTAKDFLLNMLLAGLSAVAGVLIFINPGLSMQALTLLLGFYFIFSGIFKIVATFIYNYNHWVWLLISGIVSVILGGMIVTGWPATSLWVIGTLMAIDLIFVGWSYIILSFALKGQCCKE